MDAVSEARLQLVAPALGAKITQMALLLEQQGIYVRVVQGLRSWAEQDALYAQGRTAAGNIVTNVRGGYSYHNFGMAADLVPSQYGPGQPYNPDWNKAHPSWIKMEQLGQSLGLDSGANWKRLVDAPHFQLQGRFPEKGPDDEVRQIFRDGGSEAVWREAGINT